MPPLHYWKQENGQEYELVRVGGHLERMNRSSRCTFPLLSEVESLVGSLLSRAAAAEARVAEAERLLRRMEWYEPISNHTPSCPACEAFDHDGHERGCPLAAFLAAAPPAAPPEPLPLPAEVQRVVETARIWERFRRDPGLSPAGVLREDASRDLERAVAALRASRKETR